MIETNGNDDNENKQKITQGAIRCRKIIPRVYFSIMIIMVVIICCNVIWSNKKKISFGLDSYERIDSELLDEQGNHFRIKNMDTYSKRNEDIDAYFQIPDDLQKSKQLVFRSKNCSVKVYVEDNLLYETDAVKVPFPNHSPGTRWNVIHINSADAGKTVKFVVHMAYYDGRAKIDNLYFGDGTAIIIRLIQNKGISLSISILMLFVGILFLIANAMLNHKRSEKDHSLMYIGIFAIICSMWCVLETNIMQLFVGRTSLLQVMDNMMLVLGAMPLFLYLDAYFHLFRKRIGRILCLMDLVYICLATISQIVGGPDYHQTLIGAIIAYSIVIVLLLWYLIKEELKQKKMESIGKKLKIYNLLQLIGIMVLTLGVAGDLLRYMLIDVLDRAFIVRISLLIFIICFGAGNIHRLIKLILLGKKTQMVSKLAYRDGLTDMANRTAFIEKKEELIRNSPKLKVGIIMMDFNNLKYINDNYGHYAGDEMIKSSAEVIVKTFGLIGEVFRIGGDEFTVLIIDENPKERYMEICPLFFEEVNHFNEKMTDYKMSVAHGSAYTDTITKEGIEAAENEADRVMYRNKAEIKARMKEEENRKNELV